MMKCVGTDDRPLSKGPLETSLHQICVRIKRSWAKSHEEDEDYYDDDFEEDDDEDDTAADLK